MWRRRRVLSRRPSERAERLAGVPRLPPQLQSEIARENVSRILNDWIRDKLVSRLSGYYCLENKTRLERESAL